MKAISFNSGWTCRHLEEEGPGLPVSIPHDAMLAEPKSETAPGGTNTGWYEGFDYLYQKSFFPIENLVLFDIIKRRNSLWRSQQNEIS